MGDCNDQGPAAGPCDPPTIVPDSIVSVALEKEAAAACFADQSHSSHLPLVAAKKPTYPASVADVNGRSSMIPSPNPTVVLPGDASAARLAHNTPNSKVGETPQQQQGLPAAGLDPLELPALPEVDGSPELPRQPRPGSAEPSPPNQNNIALWRNLVRQVGAAAATRPSLCACKKLAVAAMLSSDDGKGGATQRPGRVCANRGKQADCLYRAFNDAPIVPSTTVSSKTLSLLLHMKKSDPSTPTEEEGERTEDEEKTEGASERGCDNGPGGGVIGGAKKGGDGVKDEKRSGGVGEGKEHEHRHGQGATESFLVGGSESCGQGKVVLVEIRRWLMDCVASVHCANAALRGAMSRIVPPELGQTHLSPDGGGQLIALHVAAVTLLVESLPTLPGVLRVEGADKTASIFTSAQAVPPTTITPARRPASVCPQQPGSNARLPRQSSSPSQKMAAPVPIRASELVAPSMWDLADMGGQGGDNVSSTRTGGGGGGGAAAGGGSGGQASGTAGQNVGGASSHAGGSGYLGASPADLLGVQGVDAVADGMAAMLPVPADSTVFSTEADQQLPCWEGRASTGTAWPALGSRSQDLSRSGAGAGGCGGSIGGALADSAGDGGAAQGGSDAGIYRQGQGQQQVSAPSVVSSRGSTSSFYDCQYAEAAPPKRQKTETVSSVGLAGVARPIGQHLQGYASLFGGDASPPSGNTFGGALAYSKLGDTGIGGISLGDLAGDSFGTSGVDVGSAWVDSVFDSESASSSPFLLNERQVSETKESSF
eukprot:g9150.t1